MIERTAIPEKIFALGARVERLLLLQKQLAHQELSNQKLEIKYRQELCVIREKLILLTESLRIAP